MEKLIFPEQADDWQFLLTFLPAGWQDQAKALGAIQRCRKFERPETLLRTLFIHLSDGCSLRETAVRAKHGNIVDISDVALLKRLKAAGAWLQWMAAGVMQKWIEKQPDAIFGDKLRIRLIDGTTVQEPGSTGATWRMHYSILLPSLQCNEVHVTSPKVGESFKRFTVEPGDVFLGDRGYAHREALWYVLEGGGQVLVRINLTNLPLVDEHGAPFPLLERLRTLTGTRLGDWEVRLPAEQRLIPGRLCALKKNKGAAERARLQALRESHKKWHKVRPETLEAAEYTFVFTTLPGDAFTPAKILEMYRGRWQIEIVFKRLKSLLGLGHLNKTDVALSKAWLQGKLLVAFLIEALVAAAERFFPWGYPLPVPQEQMSVERNLPHGSLG
jgi:Transposase DDE domain